MEWCDCYHLNKRPVYKKIQNKLNIFFLISIVFDKVNNVSVTYQ